MFLWSCPSGHPKMGRALLLGVFYSHCGPPHTCPPAGPPFCWAADPLCWGLEFADWLPEAEEEDWLEPRASRFGETEGRVCEQEP